MPSDTKDQSPTGPYHAGPGTGHEIGIMIGFMAAFVLITLGYLVMWRVGNKKGEAKERERRQLLAEKTSPRDTNTVGNEKEGDEIGVAAGGY